MSKPTHADYDGAFNDVIRCPYCNEEDHEQTDYPSSLQHDGDNAPMTCAYCNEDFEVTLCVEYTYAADPLRDSKDRE